MKGFVERRDQFIIWTGVIGATLLCWAWIVPMARDMYGAMNGPSAWMMAATWDTPYLLLLWAMWAVMMAGMMLPAVSPVLLLYHGALRRLPDPQPRVGRVAALAAGYLLVWLLFSAAATLLQRVLSGWLLLTPMMETATPSASAALLLIAGAYQFTPLKGACLRACRSPLSFMTYHWRAGATGAFRMGLAHGVYCLGCCWALMLLLFAGGVMNLWVIVVLTLFVLVEKIAPFGSHTGRTAGALLIGAGLWMLIR